MSKNSSGPYALLGLCFGGITAFELGKRLEARGHTLSFCGGLDVTPSLHDMLRISSDRSSIQLFLLDLLVYHKVITTDQLPALEARFVPLPETEAVAAIAEHFRSQGIEDAGLQAEKIEAWYRVNCMAQAVAKAHVPRGNVRCYDVFWAKPYETWSVGTSEWRDLVMGWDRFVRDGARYWEVEGHHFSLLDKENAERLAGTLVEAMGRRELELVKVEGGERVVGKGLVVVNTKAVVEKV